MDECRFQSCASGSADTPMLSREYATLASCMMLEIIGRRRAGSLICKSRNCSIAGELQEKEMINTWLSSLPLPSAK